MGGAEASLAKLVELYGILANRGFYQPLKFLVNQAEPGSSKSVLSKEVALLITKIMKANPPPKNIPHANFFINEIKPAWKTGTSNGLRDARAIGYFGNFILGVWIGDFKNVTNRAFIGRDLAGPLLFEIMEALQSNLLPSLTTAGYNIEQVEICSLTGDVAGSHCPHKVQTEYIPGKTLLKPCFEHAPNQQIFGQHSKLKGEKNTSLPVSQNGFVELHEIQRINALKLDNATTFQLPINFSRFGLEILSPSPNLQYILVDSSKDIPLLATCYGNKSKIFWYVNNAFIGTQIGMAPVLWTAEAGTHEVIAVNESGEYASTKITVKTLYQSHERKEKEH